MQARQSGGVASEMFPASRRPAGTFPSPNMTQATTYCTPPLQPKASTIARSPPQPLTFAAMPSTLPYHE